jgi:cell wall-associated NlpC family hydrolase
MELLDSQRAADLATDVAQRATQRVDGAQQQVGQLAAQTYRAGGSIASLDVLLSPSGPAEVLERVTMMHTLAEQRHRQVHRMDAARVVAATLDKQADEALARQTAAAHKLELARAAANRRAATAHAMLATETTARNALLVKLAATRKTTVAVQRARQAGLVRVGQLRRQAQQRWQARQASRQSSRSSAGSSTGSGSIGSGSGGSGSGNSGSAASEGSSNGSSSSGQSAVSWAERQVGLPYQWGGAGPGSYDCSGLTMRAWEQGGVSMPHSSRMQYRQVSKISYANLRPGDLVFYATNPGNQATIHHVAMYVGNGQMVEAPYTGANVRVTSLRRDGSMPYAGRP